MDVENIIKRTISFVKEMLAGAEAGHDWFHIERVYRNALYINAEEQGHLLTVSLAALLHDIADSKFNNGDEEVGPQIAKEFMQRLEIPEEVILHVCGIIKNMSYKASLGAVTFSSKELDIVQDADRLDAIGAIGIARAFTYGGYKNRLMYDPAIAPDLSMDKEVYKNSTAPTINHFYEKLLRLKNLMKTDVGLKMAAARHEFMLVYLDQFYSEWEGKS
ncbi:HD domain-containing protein [Pedobacter sp. L105]|uniref:HD domain-containing protein n=1 Tax=Pedobacter sp. L105 TaxID=1641871 RepID=UPI00131D8F5F|nr:HD domain-containing protein [Pedobacter sp. L105]